MKVKRLSEICIQISDMFTRLVSEIVRPRVELRRGETHAAVTSQLRIPSLTHSHNLSVSPRTANTLRLNRFERFTSVRIPTSVCPS
jgi:hypothetical protein